MCRKPAKPQRFSIHSNKKLPQGSFFFSFKFQNFKALIWNVIRSHKNKVIFHVLIVKSCLD